MKRLFILTLLLLSFAQVRAQTNGYEAKAEIYGFVGAGTGFEVSNALYGAHLGVRF